VLVIVGRDGAMAEALSLPAVNLHAVPDSVTDEQATFVEPLAAACEILEQSHLPPDARVCVIGDGKLGLLVARVLALAGAELTIVGRHEAKMALAPAARRLLAADFAPRREYDVIVEASGKPGGWELAARAVRPRGMIVLKSTYAGSFDFNPAPLVVDEITLLGSRCGPFAPALRLLAAGRVAVDDLIAAVYPFAEAVEAFAAARCPGTLKVLLAMS
jgi:2-desacetyl-2-hydroxyethyl bacteriochlorophyllide A dehydrogenase